MISKTSLKTLNSNQLLYQYDVNANLVDTYWKEAHLSGGNCEYWFGLMHEAKENCKVLKDEILSRKANGSLYDGKRSVIANVWAWAKEKASDHDHCYNIVRKVMMKKHDIYMLEVQNSGVFAQ